MYFSLQRMMSHQCWRREFCGGFGMDCFEFRERAIMIPPFCSASQVSKSGENTSCAEKKIRNLNRGRLTLTASTTVASTCSSLASPPEGRRVRLAGNQSIETMPPEPITPTPTPPTTSSTTPSTSAPISIYLHPCVIGGVKSARKASSRKKCELLDACHVSY